MPESLNSSQINASRTSGPSWTNLPLGPRWPRGLDEINACIVGLGVLCHRFIDIFKGCTNCFPCRDLIPGLPNLRKAPYRKAILSNYFWWDRKRWPRGSGWRDLALVMWCPATKGITICQKGKCLVQQADTIRRLTRGLGFMSHPKDMDGTRSRKYGFRPTWTF